MERPRALQRRPGDRRARAGRPTPDARLQSDCSASTPSAPSSATPCRGVGALLRTAYPAGALTQDLFTAAADAIRAALREDIPDLLRAAERGRRATPKDRKTERSGFLDIPTPAT